MIKNMLSRNRFITGVISEVKHHKMCNIMLTLGIVWIMSCMIFINVNAKTSFKKTKPVGIMSTAVGTDVVITWEKLSGASGYEVYEQNVSEGDKRYTRVKTISSTKVILNDRKQEGVYRYYVRAYKKSNSRKKTYSKNSAKVSTTVPLKGTSTVKNFLRTAIAPIGSTMYVWGGGWNKADTAAGKEAKRLGLSSSWRTFASNKNAKYNYKKYRNKIHNGLDCSGYVGWCIYNVCNTMDNQEGYVMKASKQAYTFSEKGWGTYRPAGNIEDYKPGDIMSSSDHVWIAVGQCNDGSVVLLHASPPIVQLSGTATPSGNKNSQAYKLAKKYMKKYYGAWYKKYPNVGRGASYLKKFGQMRWDVTSDSAVLSDPDGYMDMRVEDVLKDLFK